MALGVVLALLNTLKHPLVQAVQFQACLILLTGIVGWTLSGLRRRKEANRLTTAGYAAALQESGLHTTQQQQHQRAKQQQQQHCAIERGACTDRCSRDLRDNGTPQQMHNWNKHNQQQQQQQKQRLRIDMSQPAGNDGHNQQQQQQQQPPGIYKSWLRGACASAWPPLAVVLPVKGCRQHSRDNWATQLAAYYGGPRLLVFAVESADDPAAAALTDMMQQQQARPNSSRAERLHKQPRGAVMAQEQQQQSAPGEQQQQQQQSAPGEQQQQQYSSHVLSTWQMSTDQVVVLVAAGLATICSQKIHNILAGVEVALATLQQQQQHGLQQQQQQRKVVHRSDSVPAGSPSSKADMTAAAAASISLSWDGSARVAAAAAGSAGALAGFVCILDDDVMLHPLSFCQMVDEMEADQSLYMVTGYPFDIVAVPESSSSSSSPGFWGRLLAYAAASYHLPLLIGFSVADRGTFVWGGAMMLRAAELQTAAAQETAAAAAAAGQGPVSASQQPNILQIWRNGGYSDDLLLAGFCAGNKLSIGLPASSYFPQLLPASFSLQQYWNYLRRQLYVLDTYYSSQHKNLNHTLMVLHSYGSAVFSVATVTAVLQIVLLSILLGPAIVQRLPAAAAAGAPGSSSSTGSSGTLSEWLQILWTELSLSLRRDIQQELAAAGTSSSSTGSCPLYLQHLPLSTWLFVCSVLASLAAVGFMVQQVLRLFRVLSPHAAREVLAPRINLGLLWLGWVFENMVLPYCMLYTALCDHIVWGGIKYYKKNGKVAGVLHLNAQLHDS